MNKSRRQRKESRDLMIDKIEREVSVNENGIFKTILKGRTKHNLINFKGKLILPKISRLNIMATK